MVSPIGYAELVSAAAFGYAVFGDFPDGFTWIGAALIVGSGLVVVYGERAWRRSPAFASHLLALSLPAMSMAEDTY